MKPVRPIPELTDKNKELFWRKVSVKGPDECWPWIGATLESGCGQIRIAGKNYLASRLSIFIHSGKDPAPLFACHKCDNPNCVNPAHLFTGTHSDNMNDMVAKCRHWIRRDKMKGDNNPSRRHPERLSRGEEHYAARITADGVRTLRAAYQAGGRTQQSLAEEFGIDQTTVSLIVCRKKWKHV